MGKSSTELKGKEQIKQQFNDIMNCKDWNEIVDPFPVAAKLIGQELGFDKETWMKLAIIEQYKELKKLREKLGVKATGTRIGISEVDASKITATEPDYE